MEEDNKLTGFKGDVDGDPFVDGKEEEKFSNCGVVVMDDLDKILDHEAHVGTLNDSSISISIDDNIESEVTGMDVEHLETIHEGMIAGTNCKEIKKEVIVSISETDLVSEIESVGVNSHLHFMCDELDHQKKSIVGARARKTRCATENIELETKEPSASTVVSKSGRKRRLKKISSSDVLDKESAFTSRKNDNDWVFDELEPASPSLHLVSVGKRAHTKKVAAKREKENSLVTGDKNCLVVTRAEMNVSSRRCKICDIVFRSQSQFENHKLICGALKPVDREIITSKVKSEPPKSSLVCPICQKSFARWKALKKHFPYTHSNLIHMGCVLCSKKIGDINDCYEHFKSEHQKSFPEQKEGLKANTVHSCPVCNYSIQSKSIVKEHLFNSHSNLVHVSCALCQRTVGSMLQCLPHFNEYHLHSSVAGKRNNEVVTTNTAQAMQGINQGRKPDIANSDTRFSSEKSNVVCLQCNKYFANYKLLALHMLSHKVDENADMVGQKVKAQTSPPINIPPASDEDSPGIVKALLNVSAIVGPDLLPAISRSLTAMTELAAGLNLELQWKETDDPCSREDLVGRLNKLLLFSSSISDIGKCLLLVLEECLQVRGNLYLLTDNPWDEFGEEYFEEDQVTPVETDSAEGCEIDGTKRDNEHLNYSSAAAVTFDSTLNSYEEAMGIDGVEEGEENLSDAGSKDDANLVVTFQSPTDETKELSSCHVSLECLPETGHGFVGVIDQQSGKAKASTSKGTRGSRSESTISEVSGAHASESEKGGNDSLTTVLEVTKSSKGSKKFTCKLCKKQFNRRYHLKTHMLTHSDLKPFKCHICPSTFKSNARLKQHAAIHLNDHKFKCDFCNFSDRTKLLVKKHCLDVHPQEPLFSCDVCVYKERTSHHITDHMAVHEPKTCTHCGLECRNSFELRRHIDTNHGKFFCSECSYSCSHNHQLKCHFMRAHVKSEAEEAYCCEICGATFNNKSKLRYHVVRHENRTPHACNQCDFKCSSKASLVLHLQKHTGLRPYKCSICNASFFRSSYLNQHMLIHSDEKSYCCRYCGKGFAFKYNCQEHEMIHTGEKKFKCQFCSFACRRRRLLTQHMIEHEARGSGDEETPGLVSP